MTLFDIILLAIALAMDCFMVSIVSGILLRTCYPVPSPLRMASLFGLFQGLMPLLGWLGMVRFQDYIQNYNHWVAFALLLFIGGKMVWESFDDDERHFNPLHLLTQLLLAVATSIDALAVGITFSCTGYDTLRSLALPLVVIALASFLFSVMGYYLGRRFGKSITRRIHPELLGGIILILIGVKILLFQ